MYNTKEIDDFRKKCYAAYQLDWMMSHGMSLTDLFNTFKGYAKGCYDISIQEGEDLKDGYGAKLMEYALEAFNECEDPVWACKEEFLDAEYQDTYYMKHLLTTMGNYDELAKMYQEDTGNSLSCVPELQVETTAGMLNAYKSADPGQPGIVVMLQPDAYEEEIDAAYVSVHQDKEHRTSDNEGEKDVVIMSYGDATTEDYTTKEIIRRDDIIAGLGPATHV